MDDLSLSQEEIAYLEPVHARLSARAHHQLSLHILLERWEALVINIEASDPRELTYEEFANDVSCRGIIERDIARDAPESLKAKIAATLAPWDERYRSATGEVDQAWFGAQNRDEWWWYWCPKDWLWYGNHRVAEPE